MLWGVKIAAKLMMARLPAGYDFWRKMGLFRHGSMDSVEYGCRIAQQHLRHRVGRIDDKAFVALELGPGDSLASALVAKSCGVKQIYLVDSGPFATMDMHVYRAMLGHLRSQAQPDGLQDVQVSSFDEMLRSCGATYLVEGLESLKQIPSGTVDLLWSHAVLEHVERDCFLATMQELRRILSPAGIASHRVDLKDHLGGALNNLRFGDEIWESHLFRHSGFYTNRIRFSEMLKLFGTAGFEVEHLTVNKWQELPTNRNRLHNKFRSLCDEELLVSGFDVLLRATG